MRKWMCMLSVVAVCSTATMASDIAFYVGAPNVDGWYSVAEMNKNVATIIDMTGHLFKDVQQFNDSQFAEFGAWVDENTDDGELDILWLNGCMPSVLYTLGNAQANGSRAELWLDGGNMIINVGDWFGYCSYEGGARKSPENGGTGAANILDLSSGIIVSADNTTLTVTAAGQQYLPSMGASVITYRPIAPSAVVAPWEVAAVFAQNATGTQADPIVIHNTVTGGYVAFVNQSAGSAPPGWLADRGITCAEFILNWVNEVVGLASPSLAVDPVPDDGTVDVHRDVVLSWMAGQTAAAHDVYFGVSFADVNDASRADPKGVLVSQGQTDTTFDPEGLLEYGQVYYWRIDEVNGAPDNTIFKGETWTFAAEPYSYPVTPVAATASSAQTGMGPQNTINGSGLNANDEHSTELTQMWMSAGAKPNWIQYEFDKVYKLDKLLVWNSNQLIETFLGFGAKDVTIEYSTDGATWATLDGVPEFARATATAAYQANTTVDLGGLAAQFVKLTINQTWGGVAPQTGLSEVRFFVIPVQAFEPTPAVAATGVGIDTDLLWRPGREAESHEVYLGTDENALALVDTVTAASAKPSSLDFGTTYFWKVDEVGGDGPYEGELWSFTTQEYAVIDDMESYNDDDNRIYDSWIDGLTETAKGGSQVGYDVSPFAEKSIIHGGKQAMPLMYDNSAAPFLSETEQTFAAPQNWTVSGADTLSLYVRGSMPAFVETAAGSVLMNGLGTDIWNNADQFRFAYKTLNGNGTMIARVESIFNSNVWAKGGVMIRQSIEPGSTHAFMPITPGGSGAGNGASFQHRLVANGASTNNDNTAPAVAAPYWVKIERNGNSFTGAISPDGKTWKQLGGAQTITMTGPVLIGLALCSHDAAIVTGAEFSNIAFTGNVTGGWQMAEIGATQPAGNSVEGLYVTLKDSSGKSATIANPDTAATARGGWTQWKIPLSDFAAAGVKMNAVKSMTIGVGNKSAPVKGGAGTLFLDDLGFGRPLP